MPRKHSIGVIAVGVIVLGACGGNDANESADVLPSPTIEDEAGNDDGGTPRAPSAAQVDLVGPEVVPASEIETNQLPSVVLDDVSRGTKVNFRNLVPQDKPILLWAYAPH